MAGVISDLKAQARILHRQIVEHEPVALARAQQLVELRDDPASLPVRIKRRHCLAVIARELGFQGWPHIVAVLRGTDSSDFGTLLCPKGSDVHWNIWSASYAEARAIREEHGGYLLAYRRHFFITDRHFIDTGPRSGRSGLGVDRTGLGEAKTSGRARTALWQTHSPTDSGGNYCLTVRPPNKQLEPAAHSFPCAAAQLQALGIRENASIWEGRINPWFCRTLSARQSIRISFVVVCFRRPTQLVDSRPAFSTRLASRQTAGRNWSELFEYSTLHKTPNWRTPTHTARSTQSALS